MELFKLFLPFYSIVIKYFSQLNQWKQKQPAHAPAEPKPYNWISVTEKFLMT